MSTLTFTQAFFRYGAHLSNPQWSVSSINEQNELVISCWSVLLKPAMGKLRYSDTISRWEKNRAGSAEFKRHLTSAQKKSLPIRMVVATPKSNQQKNNVELGAGIKKTFSVRQDLAGKLVAFDGNEFVIEFSKVEL